MNHTISDGQNKPGNLRIIFILNALKILLSTGLFIGFKYHGLTIGTLSAASGASIVLYTTIGYVITFTAMVISILRRNLIGIRLAIAADFLISIPAKAFVGVLISVISISLTFTKSVKKYFAWQPGVPKTTTSPR
ncbi:MAG: hypothetical protein AAF404_18950 [Pseudomonadota bacterium]